MRLLWYLGAIVIFSAPLLLRQRSICGAVNVREATMTQTSFLVRGGEDA